MSSLKGDGFSLAVGDSVVLASASWTLVIVVSSFDGGLAWDGEGPLSEFWLASISRCQIATKLIEIQCSDVQGLHLGCTVSVYGMLRTGIDA